MLYRIRDALNRRALDRALQGVLDTPPAVMDAGASFALLSQIREKDLFMYLVAVKSFCSFLAPRQVYLLVDGGLSPMGRDILNANLPYITIQAHSDYRDARCPTGGTWERLIGLATHAADSYVIQLDADTVTLSQLPEVHDSIAAGTAFTLGSRQGQQMEPCGIAAARAREWLSKGDSHVQVLAESVLDKFVPPDGPTHPVYVRGCSGFVGIPRYALSRDRVASWAQALAPLVGARWSEWGTEQFMSNLMIANMADRKVLPHPRYVTCPGPDEESHAIFAHMAGFCRFADHRYARFAGRALATIQRRAAV